MGAPARGMRQSRPIEPFSPSGLVSRTSPRSVRIKVGSDCTQPPVGSTTNPESSHTYAKQVAYGPGNATPVFHRPAQYVSCMVAGPHTTAEQNSSDKQQEPNIVAHSISTKLQKPWQSLTSAPRFPPTSLHCTFGIMNHDQPAGAPTPFVVGVATKAAWRTYAATALAGCEPRR